MKECEKDREDRQWDYLSLFFAGSNNQVDSRAVNSDRLFRLQIFKSFLVQAWSLFADVHWSESVSLCLNLRDSGDGLHGGKEIRFWRKSSSFLFTISGKRFWRWSQFALTHAAYLSADKAIMTL